jgi:hypothetical protein
MWALRYKGDIKAYVTSFRALNRLAKSTGEAMQDMVNKALPTDIVHMRFARSAGTFTDDDTFWHATFEAGRQVELEKNVIKRHESVPMGSQGSSGNSKGPGKVPKGQGKKEKDEQPAGESNGSGQVTSSKGPGTKRWESIQAALQGVPEIEIADHNKSKDNCLRCGRTGHRCIACYAKTTVAGTKLPAVPDKAPDTANVASVKRKYGSGESTPAKKQAQASAISVGIASDKTRDLSIWAIDSEEEEDFY